MVGHSDNCFAAVYGGLVISIVENENVFYKKINVSKDISVDVITPKTQKKEYTDKLRSVLANEVSRSTAVYNLARCALLVGELSGSSGSNNFKQENLFESMKDKIHQNQRMRFYKGMKEVIEKVEEEKKKGMLEHIL